MRREVSRPQEMPPKVPQSALKKKRTQLYIGVALTVIIALSVIIAVVVIALIPSFQPKSKITQVLVKVEYGGSWLGLYSNGLEEIGTQWGGQGPKTITLNRPSTAVHTWVVVASATKTDYSGATLRVMITKTDGTILEEDSTNIVFGTATVELRIED